MTADDVVLRSMAPEDVGPADVLTARTFDRLFRTTGGPARPPRDAAATRRERGRLAHLLLEGPDRAVVATAADGRLVGHALSAVREGLWILSLLIVDPALHSRGVGRRLLEAVLPDPGSPGLIAASPDPRAVALYTAAGFRPRPTLMSSGPLRRPPAPQPEVRDGGPPDLDGCDEVDRWARGAWRRPDLELLLAHGTRLRVLDGEGFAMASGSRLLTLSARSEAASATLLRDHLAGQPPGAAVEVGWITQDSQWALDVLLDAGVGFAPMGALCVRPAGRPGEGTPGRPRPDGSLPRGTYLASGAYL
jgi:GNAT superfamily N-acetyltransferase